MLRLRAGELVDGAGALGWCQETCAKHRSISGGKKPRTHLAGPQLEDGKLRPPPGRALSPEALPFHLQSHRTMNRQLDEMVNC